MEICKPQDDGVIEDWYLTALCFWGMGWSDWLTSLQGSLWLVEEVDRGVSELIYWRLLTVQTATLSFSNMKMEDYWFSLHGSKGTLLDFDFYSFDLCLMWRCRKAVLKLQRHPPIFLFRAARSSRLSPSHFPVKFQDILKCFLVEVGEVDELDFRGETWAFQLARKGPWNSPPVSLTCVEKDGVNQLTLFPHSEAISNKNKITLHYPFFMFLCAFVLFFCTCQGMNHSLQRDQKSVPTSRFVSSALYFVRTHGFCCCNRLKHAAHTLRCAGVLSEVIYAHILYSGQKKPTCSSARTNAPKCMACTDPTPSV